MAPTYHVTYNDFSDRPHSLEWQKGMHSMEPPWAPRPVMLVLEVLSLFSASAVSFNKSMTGGSQDEPCEGAVHCGMRERRRAGCETASGRGGVGQIRKANPDRGRSSSARSGGPWPTIPAGGSKAGLAGGSRCEGRPSEAGRLRAPGLS